MKAVAVVAVVAVAGCATIVSRGPDEIPLASEPQGADVAVNGHAAGRTPMILVLDRGSPAIVDVRLAGYKPVTFTYETGFNPWTLGNIVMFPLVLVDILDGNWRRFDDTPILVALHRI